METGQDHVSKLWTMQSRFLTLTVRIVYKYLGRLEKWQNQVKQTKPSWHLQHMLRNNARVRHWLIFFKKNSYQWQPGLRFASAIIGRLRNSVDEKKLPMKQVQRFNVFIFYFYHNMYGKMPRTGQSKSGHKLRTDFGKF